MIYEIQKNGYQPDLLTRKTVIAMRPFDRDLLVMLRTEFMTEQAIEQEVENIHNLLIETEVPEIFCTAHELANRYKISQNPNKILLASLDVTLKPFHFLINKN